MNVPEKYQATIEFIISTARGFMAEGKELQAFVFLGKAGAPLLPCPMNMKDGQTKDISAMVVREIAREGKAEFAIMISEAWGLDHTKVSMEEIKEYYESHGGISEHPNRIDVVMITLEAPEGFWIAQAPIKSSGEAREFGDPDFAFMTRAEGRFACFLPQSGPVH